jgi:hypothetical protein
MFVNNQSDVCWDDLKADRGAWLVVSSKAPHIVLLCNSSWKQLFHTSDCISPKSCTFNLPPTYSSSSYSSSGFSNASWPFYSLSDFVDYELPSPSSISLSSSENTPLSLNLSSHNEEKYKLKTFLSTMSSQHSAHSLLRCKSWRYLKQFFYL